MNFALAQMMVHRPRVFRGGKAPLFFKRELSGLTEELGSMPRRCDWVTEIAEMHPHLLSEPLLGECLAAVTATRVVRSESNDDPTDDRMTSPHIGSNRGNKITNEPTGSSKRDQISSPAVTGERSGDRPQLEMVAQLPRRAPGSLLRRVGPDTSKPGQELIATSSLPRGGPGSPPVHSSPTITRSEWLRLVADRAAKKWTSDWIFPPTRSLLSPAVESRRNNRSRTPEPAAIYAHRTASPSPAAVEAIVVPSLDDDWLLPIGGQQASPQLLASLVRHARRDRETPERIHRSETPQHRRVEQKPTWTKSVPPAVAGGSLPAHGSECVETYPLPQGGTDWVPTNPNSSSPSAPSINSTEFAPTTLTRDLSPLLPPVSPESPPIPAAAEAARRIAWRDEVEAHDADLSILAAQMKRILDEEARRHGIDV